MRRNSDNNSRRPTRVTFLECGGNGGPLFSPQPLQANLQALHGLASCAEWTGVRLSTLLEETGIDPKAKWFIAEGADAPHLARSVPLKKALDDAMIAFYQNGERLMPANGYPMRLLLPGYEGNMNIKYLRRIKLVEGPAMSFWEAKTYAPILPNGKAYQFYLLQEVKSFITQPSPGLRAPAPPARSTSPAARQSLTRQRIQLTRSSICWTDAAAPEPRAGSVRAPTPSSTSSWNLTGRRRSRASCTRSRRRCGSVPRKYAWKSRRMAADRIAKFRFRNRTSAPGEPPTSTKNSASVSPRSLISVSRLFQTRAAPARRRLQRSGSSLKRPGAAAPSKSILKAANVPIIGSHHVLALQSSPEDAKQHRYWSVVENTRVAGGRVVQRHVLSSEHPLMHLIRIPLNDQRSRAPDEPVAARLTRLPDPEP
jgi:DMSO/TMAO reductase YedYZ molybdopterin-dependent catalytic subunit